MLLAAAAGSVAAEPPVADGAAPAAAVDGGRAATTLPSRWVATRAAEQGGYRLSLSNGVVDVGMRFEPRPVAAHAVDGRYDSALPPGALWPSLSLGVVELGKGPVPATTLIERALAAPGVAAPSGKVSLEWKPAQSQVFFHQGLGVRLGGEDRLVMRLRKGSLGVYMQTAF